MKAIDNTAALGYDQKKRVLTAAATFTYVVATKVLTVTEASTVASGDTFAAMNVTVADKFGKKKEWQITTAAATLTKDLGAEGFNVTEGVDVLVTIVTTGRIAKNGSVYNVGPAKLSGSVTMDY